MIAFIPDSFYIFRLRFSVMAKEKSVFVLRRPVSRFVSPVPACPLRGAVGIRRGRIPGPSDFQERGKCLAMSVSRKLFERKEIWKSRYDSVPERSNGRMAGIPRIRDLKRLFCGQPKSSVRNQSVAMRSSFG